MKLAAVVIAYCPNIDLLKKNLILIGEQVDQIFLIDNTPMGSINSFKRFKVSCPISYIPLMVNTGIAHAQNFGTKLAIESGFDHFIYFDQDSTPEPNMVTNLISAQMPLLKAGVSLGLIGPSFIDSESKKTAKIYKRFSFFIYKSNLNASVVEPVLAEYIISSGSMIGREVFDKVGYFDERLFIDWVDVEFCLRVSKLGFCNYVAPEAKMTHTLGDGNVNLGGSKIFHKHSDTRNYYIVRNAAYLAFRSSIPIYWRVYIAAKLPFYIVIFSFTSSSENRIKILILLIKAFLKGVRAYLGKAF